MHLHKRPFVYRVQRSVPSQVFEEHFLALGGANISPGAVPFPVSEKHYTLEGRNNSSEHIAVPAVPQHAQQAYLIRILVAV